MGMKLREDHRWVMKSQITPKLQGWWEHFTGEKVVIPGEF